MKKQATDLVACFFVARRCEGTTIALLVAVEKAEKLIFFTEYHASKKDFCFFTLFLKRCRKSNFPQ